MRKPPKGNVEKRLPSIPVSIKELDCAPREMIQDSETDEIAQMVYEIKELGRYLHSLYHHTETSDPERRITWQNCGKLTCKRIVVVVEGLEKLVSNE